jgi:hypothetical protein
MVVDQRLCEAVDAELHGASEVDVPKVRRSHPAQPVVVNAHATAAQPLDGFVHSGGIPGQHEISQQDVSPEIVCISSCRRPRSVVTLPL